MYIQWTLDNFKLENQSFLPGQLKKKHPVCISSGHWITLNWRKKMPDFFTWSYLDRCCVFVVEWLSLLSGCLPRSTTVTRWFAGLVDILLNSGPRFQVEESKRKRKGEREKGRNERKEDVDEKRVEKWRRREKWEIKGRMKNMRGERRKWIPRSVFTQLLKNQPSPRFHQIDHYYFQEVLRKAAPSCN